MWNCRVARLFLCSLLLQVLSADLSAADGTATPWEQAYAGGEATGNHVLGLWKFDSDNGLDATGRQPQGRSNAGRFVAAGRFGGGLESFAGFPEADRSHGFVVPNNPRLSPNGAFTIELWIKPKPEFAKRDWAVVIDKKYAGHDDYQLAFGAADPKQQRRMTLSLGFGNESQLFVSEAGEFPADEWTHIAATYNGRGRVQFFRNGESFGQVDAPGRGSISAGSLPLSIGDRLGSNYPGFPGFLDEVRLTSGVREFGQLRIAMKRPRATYVRFEPAPKWTVTVTNLRNEPVDGVTLRTSLGNTLPTEEVLPKFAPGGTQVVEQSFDTSLRPDTYTVTLTATLPGERPRRITESFPVTLVARPLPQRMPVVMWGVGGVKEVVTELPRLKQMGFTHCLGGEVDHHRIATADGPTLVTKPEQMPATIEMLDAALANDLHILASTWPTYFEPTLKEFLQVGRGGAVLKRRSLTPNAPQVMRAFERAGESIAQTFAEHPAFEGLLVNSEVRDESEVSFTEWDQAAHRAVFGRDIPDWVTSKYPPSFTTLKDFPANRVVPDDHPQLAFFRWWWGGGDGWNGANSAVNRGFHRGSARRDLWTFTDPVVRCPPLWGSGGDVDVLSQWTYTDPDPLRMSLPVDELFAMAGQRQARAMKMTQLFWYRSTTAPAESSPRQGDAPAKWADQDPNTSFISIHPHHLREAFWTKIARPIEGIMYHGWSSLVPTDGSHAYKYTHPQLQHELTRLTHEIVEPLGPTLRQVPVVKSDIAFLESFTSFAFATRGSWGYAGGSQADLYFALQHARLQPEVVYEQHLLRDGLDGYKLLVMADCDVLPQSVVAKVLAFQQRGGLIVGDSRLCPAIKADITLPLLVRKKDAAADRAALRNLAAEIREKLNGKYQRVVDTSSPDVVPHRRRAGTSDYVFLVNDAREAGDYVGQYGLVHELGLPTTAEVRLASNATAIYDLVEHRPVTFRRDGQTLVVPLTLGPCDGRVLMATPQPIAQVLIAGPNEVARGQTWTGRITVADAAGKPIDAVVPLHVEVRDADGRTAEFSGHYGAAGGTLDLRLEIANNDQFGMWEIRVRELASNQHATGFVRVVR